jgi:hypothetical protein
MTYPPDFDRLAPDEEIPEERLSDADRLFLERQIAEAHAEAERLRRQRIDEATASSAGRLSPPRERPPADRPGPAQDEEEGEAPAHFAREPRPGDTNYGNGKPPVFDPNALASNEALIILEQLRAEAAQNGMTVEQWECFLKKNGLTRQTLGAAAAGIVKSMTHYLASKLDLMDWHNLLYGEEESEEGEEEAE